MGRGVFLIFPSLREQVRQFHPPPVPSLQNTSFRAHLYSYSLKVEEEILTLLCTKCEIFQNPPPATQNLTASRGCTNKTLQVAQQQSIGVFTDSSQLQNQNPMFTLVHHQPTGLLGRQHLYLWLCFSEVKRGPKEAGRNTALLARNITLNQRWQPWFVAEIRRISFFETKEPSWSLDNVDQRCHFMINELSC